MDNGNVTEVTYHQSAAYIFKIWQIARKSSSLYFLYIIILFCKFWLKLDENWGMKIGMDVIPNKSSSLVLTKQDTFSNLGS